MFILACREFVSALYDWHNTAPGRLNVSVWVNDTNIGGGQSNGAQGPPEVQRWSAPVNLAGGLWMAGMAGRREGAGQWAVLCRVKCDALGAPQLPLCMSLPRGAELFIELCALHCCSQCIPEGPAGGGVRRSAGGREGHAQRCGEGQVSSKTSLGATKPVVTERGTSAPCRAQAAGVQCCDCLSQYCLFSPAGASRLSLDFSSLLGPLFSMWLLQVHGLICLQPHPVRDPGHIRPARPMLHVLLLLPPHTFSVRRRPPAPSAPQRILLVGVHTRYCRLCFETTHL